MDPQKNPINDPIDPLKPHVPEQPPSTLIQPTQPKPPEIPDPKEPKTVVEPEPVPVPAPAPAPVMYVGDDLSATSEVPQPTPVVSQDMSFGTQKPKLKIPMVVPIFALILLLLGGGYVFAFYLPNRPENVYKTGLDRSGDAIDEIVAKATEQDNLDALENSELTASLDMIADDGKSGEYNADLSMKFSKSKIDSKLSFIAKDSIAGNLDLKLDWISEVAEGKTLPDIYIRAAGYSSLGLESFVPGINKYENKWIYISADYLESQAGLVDGETITGGTVENVSAQEISEISKAVTLVTNDYIFNSDPEKAVLENREFLDKEDVDGIAMYKYKVGINAENASEYCVALAEAVLNTEGAKKLIGGPSEEEIENYKKSSREQCESLKESIKPEEEFEVWIDAKYKLISRMRFADDKDKSKYIDVGQNYTGGDEVPFYVDFSESDDFLSKGRFTVTANLASNETKGEFIVEGKDENSSLKVNATMSIKPYAEELQITKPVGAITVEDFIKDVTESSGNPVLGINSEVLQTSLFDYLPL